MKQQRLFPKNIGRYMIEDLLGSGAMGDVYLAHDTRLRRRVALKVLGGRADGVDPKAAVFSEARAASAIAHPNAMAVFDADEIDGVAYIVMEYVPGTPLCQLVGDASVPLSARLRWLVDIAGALGAAHAAALVHGDVKPENVIVRADGVAKLLDFGITRLAPCGGMVAEGSPGWTEDGFAGTPGYMAPELLRGQPIDGRADQFGWGVLAYELLTGRRPWKRANTPFGAIASVLTEKPAPLRGDVPLDVAAAVMRAMSKAPADRFPSITAAAAFLVPYLPPAGSLACPPAPVRCSSSACSIADALATHHVAQAAP